MRQRKIKNLEEKLASCGELIVEDPRSKSGAWNEVFGNQNDIYLELGCGKGKFITELAKLHPERNFIGCEGHQSVVYRAVSAANEAELDNVIFIAEYINDMPAYFGEGELSGIYLNFSDPWPKDRHAKRRLTHVDRLKAYAAAIRPGGFIRFKTDNDDLFDFTLEQIELAGLKASEISRDLHSSDFARGNVMTEYETRFSQAGKNINYVKIEL